MANNLGILKRVQLDKAGIREQDLSDWLAEHIEELGNALGLELEARDREVKVGNFKLDLLAEDMGSGRKVIIENQLNRTDHDHLGKLLTYLSGTPEASIAIWIGEEFKNEHRQALESLN